MTQRRLTNEVLADLALSALKNARRLYDDARSLAESGRVATAFVIGGLAADELGKHILVTSFAARNQTDGEWQQFWSRFRVHQEKLGDMLYSAWVGDLLTEEPPPDVEAFHQSRLAATYVDVDSQGAIQRPSEMVSTGELGKLFERLNQELDFCERVLANATPESLSSLFSKLGTLEVTQELKTIEARGPVGMLAVGIALRAGLPTEQALEFAKAVMPFFRSVLEGGPGSERESGDRNPGR